MNGVYFITGSLGGGKSLAGVNRAREYLNRGCRVATNVNLFTEYLCGPDNDYSKILRIPDAPTIENLRAIGLGYDGDEVNPKRNGLLLLDELGTWFNARDFSGKGRLAVVKWMIHMRKRRWDVAFLVQDFSMVDKQVRGNITQYLVTCQSSKDHFIFKPFPKFHIGTVRLRSKIKVDTWIYRGRDLYDAYDTEQIYFTNETEDEDEHEIIDADMSSKEKACRDLNGLYCVLPPAYLGNEVRDSIRQRHKKIYKSRGIKVAIILALITYGASLFRSPGNESAQVNALESVNPELPTSVEEVSTQRPGVVTGQSPIEQPVTYADYRIVMYSRIGDRVRYVFRHPDGFDVRQTSLENQGYTVQNRGPSEALIVGPNYEYWSVFR